jgi:hypothetical protein
MGKRKTRSRSSSFHLSIFPLTKEEVKTFLLSEKRKVLFFGDKARPTPPTKLGWNILAR